MVAEHDLFTFREEHNITGIEKKVVGEMVRPKGDEVSN